MRRIGTLALCVCEQEELLALVDEGGRCWTARTGECVGERKTATMVLGGRRLTSIGSSVQIENAD
jgi:hypothetical protein